MYRIQFFAVTIVFFLLSCGPTDQEQPTPSLEARLELPTIEVNPTYPDKSPFSFTDVQVGVRLSHSTASTSVSIQTFELTDGEHVVNIGAELLDEIVVSNQAEWLYSYITREVTNSELSVLCGAENVQAHVVVRGEECDCSAEATREVDLVCRIDRRADDLLNIALEPAPTDAPCAIDAEGFGGIFREEYGYDEAGHLIIVDAYGAENEYLEREYFSYDGDIVTEIKNILVTEHGGEWNEHTVFTLDAQGYASSANRRIVDGLYPFQTIETFNFTLEWDMNARKVARYLDGKKQSTLKWDAEAANFTVIKNGDQIAARFKFGNPPVDPRNIVVGVNPLLTRSAQLVQSYSDKDDDGKADDLVTTYTYDSEGRIQTVTAEGIRDNEDRVELYTGIFQYDCGR